MRRAISGGRESRGKRGAAGAAKKKKATRCPPRVIPGKHTQTHTTAQRGRREGAAARSPAPDGRAAPRPLIGVSPRPPSYILCMCMRRAPARAAIRPPLPQIQNHRHCLTRPHTSAASAPPTPAPPCWLHSPVPIPTPSHTFPHPRCPRPPHVSPLPHLPHRFHSHCSRTHPSLPSPSPPTCPPHFISPPLTHHPSPPPPTHHRHTPSQQLQANPNANNLNANMPSSH